MSLDSLCPTSGYVTPAFLRDSRGYIGTTLVACLLRSKHLCNVTEGIYIVRQTAGKAFHCVIVGALLGSETPAQGWRQDFG